MCMIVKHNMASQTLQKGKWDSFTVKVFAGLMQFQANFWLSVDVSGQNPRHAISG